MKTENFLRYIVLCTIIVVILLIPQLTFAQNFDLHGQLSGWIVTNPDEATQFGVRYIPDLLVGTSWDEYLLDSEISMNMFGTVEFQHNQDKTVWNDEFDPYRLWLRFASSQFELRAGLQKINFGSAMLLRPLMWFDTIDPRDPLQLTNGVWAVLGRYFFLNNSNIWLWVLYGNDQNRGSDIVASDKNSPEFGGRIQIPLLTGEIGLSYHNRRINTKSSPLGNFLSEESTIPENRIGLDGKWDIEVGLWAEAVLIHRELDFTRLDYQRQTNLGVDYTFDWGNGLYAVAEYYTFNLAEKGFDDGQGVSLTAFSLNYPFGLLDDLIVMVYYDLDNKEWYRFFRWQRTYDNWSLFLMGFWNPEQFQIFPGITQNNLFAGKGIQLLAVFNH